MAPQVIYFTSRIIPRNITIQLGNGLLVHALWWVKFHRLSMIRVSATCYAGHADPLSQAWTRESKQAKVNGADTETNMAVIWWRQAPTPPTARPTQIMRQAEGNRQSSPYDPYNPAAPLTQPGSPPYAPQCLKPHGWRASLLGFLCRKKALAYSLSGLFNPRLLLALANYLEIL